MMQTNTTPRNDMLARYAVYGLCALAMWAGVRSLEHPADSAQAQDIHLFATEAPTPALPTPALDAPGLVLIAPTPTANELPAPVWPVQNAPVASQDGSGAAQDAQGGDYIANVGAQAAHSPRGDVDAPASFETGPIAQPANGDGMIVVIDPNGSNTDPLEGIAAAVPHISQAQAQVIGARTSNGCPDGQIFYPRTGCHLEGSGGPQPGAVGER